MSVVATVGSAVAVAGEVRSTIYQVAQIIEDAQDAVGVSLPNYIKKCAMLHRVYIQKEIAGEEALYDIMVNVQNMIAAWALCALQLNATVDGSRTVRKMLDVVATESLGKTSKTYTTLERMLEKYPGIIYGAEGLYDTVKKETEEAIDTASDILKKRETEDKKHAVGGSRDGGVTEIPDSARLPSGKVINIDFTLGKDTKPQTVSVWLQLLPTLIPEQVMEQFVALNFKMSFMQRWIQLTTGEISFLKDFIAAADRRKARLDAKKKDKHGVLTDMMDKRDNSISKWFGKLAGYKANRQNIATSILVYDKYTFDRICKKTNCKFERQNDREKFFINTMAMMVIVVDSMYGTVDFYISGLDSKASYSFAQMKNNAKSDKFSLVDIMQAMSRNQAPKF